MSDERAGRKIRDAGAPSAAYDCGCGMPESGAGGPDSSAAKARRTRWQRIKRPASYWPTRYTREVPLWHPWHIGAALVRLRFRYLYWRGY